MEFRLSKYCHNPPYSLTHCQKKAVTYLSCHTEFNNITIFCYMYSVQLYVEIKYKYDKQCEIRVKTADNIIECLERNVIGMYLMYFSCVCVCGDAMYLTFGRLWQQLVGRCAQKKQGNKSNLNLSCFLYFAAQNVTLEEILSSYKQACQKLNCKPIPKVLKQIQVSFSSTQTQINRWSTQTLIHSALTKTTYIISLLVLFY